MVSRVVSRQAKEVNEGEPFKQKLTDPDHSSAVHSSVAVSPHAKPINRHSSHYHPLLLLLFININQPINQSNIHLLIRISFLSINPTFLSHLTQTQAGFTNKLRGVKAIRRINKKCQFKYGHEHCLTIFQSGGFLMSH